MAIPAVNERNGMFNGDKEASRNARRRLEYLKEMFLGVGSEEEWLDAVREDDSKLAFTLWEYWPKENNQKHRNMYVYLFADYWL